MPQFTHACIKCHATYQDDDTEAYYCETCLAEHKAMAAVIDANRSQNPKEESKGELATFLDDPRTVVKNGGNSIFVRESQL